MNSHFWETINFENNTKFYYHTQLDDIALFKVIPTIKASREAEETQSSTTGQLVKSLHTIT